MHEAHWQGFNVPKDLSVASFYDGPVAELLNPAVTSVLYPLDRLGYESVAMLVDILAGVAPTTTSIIIPHDKIVVRLSTGRAPMKISRCAQ
jgi:DNA-binding LacI/PurR family transcriptional regulator